MVHDDLKTAVGARIRSREDRPRYEARVITLKEKVEDNSRSASAFSPPMAFCFSLRQSTQFSYAVSLFLTAKMSSGE